MRYLLLDGKGLAYRAFYGSGDAVRGFSNAACRIRDDVKPHATWVAWEDGPSWRSAVWPQYKAHRKPTPPELKAQFGGVVRAAHSLSMHVLQEDNCEADDAIAIAALGLAADGHQVVIGSDDKDLLQLVRPSVYAYRPRNGKLLDATAVKAEWGVWPDQLTDVLALMGDTADNIPGVPKIGRVRAVKLVQAYGTIEAMITAGVLNGHADVALMSRRLVILGRRPSAEKETA